jgi:hypothetical protein
MGCTIYQREEDFHASEKNILNCLLKVEYWEDANWENRILCVATKDDKLIKG